MCDFIWVFDFKYDNLYDVLLWIKVFGQDLFEYFIIQFVFFELLDSWQCILFNSFIWWYFLFIVKEVLYNCFKYVVVIEVVVVLCLKLGGLEISVCDNGKGWLVNK